MSDDKLQDSNGDAIEEAAKNRTIHIDLGDLAEENAPSAAPAGAGDRGAANRTMRIDLTDLESGPEDDVKAGADAVRIEKQARPSMTRQIPLQAIPTTAPGQWKPGQHPPATVGAAQRKKETSSAVLPAPKGTDRILVSEPVAGKDAKRATAPINAAAPQQVVPKTIRLKRPATTIVAVQPGSAPTAAAPETIIKTVKLSRDTSRIPGVGSAIKKETAREQLDDAGVPPAAGEKRATKPIGVADKDAGVPKTILLKKPATVATVLRPGAVDKKSTDVIKKTTDTIIPATRKSQTTRIEVPAQDALAGAAPATQVKTVRLKRTSQAEAAAASGAAAEAEGQFDPSQMIPEMRRRAQRRMDGDDAEGQMNALFPILAVAALLVIGALTYILSSQAFGPELSVPMPASWL